MRFDDWSKEDLAWKCRELCDEIEKLKAKIYEQSDQIYSLKFRIENELEPRIKAEKQRYDRWVTNAERGGYDGD